jgi:hypothetical protein
MCTCELIDTKVKKECSPSVFVYIRIDEWCTWLSLILGYWLIASDEVGRLGWVYVFIHSFTSSTPVPPPLIQKCLNVSARRIESVCEGSRTRTGYGSCAIRVICAACGFALFLVPQLARRWIPHATTLTEAMTPIVASLKVCRYALYDMINIKYLQLKGWGISYSRLSWGKGDNEFAGEEPPDEVDKLGEGARRCTGM